jgi:hypothetical protein
VENKYLNPTRKSYGPFSALCGASWSILRVLVLRYYCIFRSKRKIGRAATCMRTLEIAIFIGTLPGK